MKTAEIKCSAWAVSIGGFRCEGMEDPKKLVRAVADAASPQLTQLIDAGGVAGYEHLFMAAVNAARSMETGLSVSKSITVEALLYASAQDQITKALVVMGVNKKSSGIALMVFASTASEAESAYRNAAKLLGEEDDTLLELDAEKSERLKKIYRVSDAEIEAVGRPDALGRLIVERGALLSLHR
jgi:tRNA threonylcarbamoyladenosine modification (KEOPS) complex Cgi121 subunit